MAEWLIERGIGETRAILVADGEILEAAIELPGTLPAGSVAAARLRAVLAPGARGIAVAKDGTEFLVQPLPPGIADGACLHVRVTREALDEPGRPKRARGAPADGPEEAGPDLAARLAACPDPVREAPAFGADPFEAAGWSELLDEAERGEIAFPGGALRMSLTPAMTLFDVDGTLPPEALAVAGAEAAARTIRRMGIAGSIGIDLPTVPRAARAAPAAAIDAILPQPFERTAVNGFGFLQIVRRQARPSLPQLLAADPAGAAARALLRRAERAGQGARLLIAAPPVIARIEAEPGWRAALERRAGAPLSLRAEPGRAISAGDVHLLDPR